MSYDYAAERFDAENDALRKGRGDDKPRGMERSIYASDDAPEKDEL